MPTANEEEVPSPERAGRARLVGDAHLAHVEHLHGVAHCGVLELRRVADPLDPRVDELVSVLEEPRQVPGRHVAVLVEGRRDDGASVLVEEFRHVRAAAEERHAEGGLGDDHLPVLPFPNIIPNVLENTLASIASEALRT